jgi:hypothetical protein
VATLALFVALGGASYAASTLPPNSVGTQQLRDGAVTAPKVKHGSLLARDFRTGQLPTGAASAFTPGVPQSGSPSVVAKTTIATTAAGSLLINVTDLNAGVSCGSKPITCYATWAIYLDHRLLRNSEKAMAAGPEGSSSQAFELYYKAANVPGGKHIVALETTTNDAVKAVQGDPQIEAIALPG